MSKKRHKGTPTMKQLYDLIHRQNFMCALTGMELTFESASPDHVVALKNGPGTNVIENIVIIDRRINEMKGGFGLEEFVELCCMVADHTRNQQNKAARNGRLFGDISETA